MLKSCVEACEALGPLGQLVTNVLLMAVTAWGMWQKWQATRSAKEAEQAKAEAQMHKEEVLSLRPPPVPVAIVGSIPPSVARDLAGDSVPPELAAADTVPPRSRR